MEIKELQNYSAEIYREYQRIEERINDRSRGITLYNIHRVAEMLCRNLYCYYKCVDRINPEMLDGEPLFYPPFAHENISVILNYLYEHRHISNDDYKKLNDLRFERNEIKRTLMETKYISCEEIEKMYMTLKEIIPVLLSKIYKARITPFKALADNKYKGTFGNSYVNMKRALDNIRKDPTELYFESYRTLYRIESYFFINALGEKTKIEYNRYLLQHLKVKDEKLLKVLRTIKEINKINATVSHTIEKFNDDKNDRIFELCRRIVIYFLSEGYDALSREFKLNTKTQNQLAKNSKESLILGDIKNDKIKELQIFGAKGTRNVLLAYSMTMGRNAPNSTNDIPLKSEIVSRRHGSFIISDNGCYYFDNDSLNGTFINNKKVKKKIPHKLKPFDVLKIDCDNKTMSNENAVVLIYLETSEEMKWAVVTVKTKTFVSQNIRIEKSEGRAFVNATSEHPVYINGAKVLNKTEIKPYDVIRDNIMLAVYMGGYLYKNIY